MKDCVVVDASLALKWVLKESDSEGAIALAREWVTSETRPVAPGLLLVEATNVLHRRALLGHFSQSQAKELLLMFLNIDIEIRESPQVHVLALELAQELQVPAVYDTHYLALAEMLDCDLWTADERFFNSVKERYPGVRLLADFVAGKR